MDNIKFISICQSIIDGYRAENFKVLYKHYDGMAHFIVMFNHENKKIVRAVINEMINFAVFSENGKIKIEIDNENKMYQY